MFLADCLALATYKSLHFLSLISICPKIYIHRCQDKTHIKIISMKLPFFILGFARILNIREKPLIRDECVHLNWWYSMCIFQKSLSNVYAFFETQEDYKNKLIWIAYLIGCNYVLSKAQLLKSFILWKYGNCPLSHVVNYKLQEELSRLELFTFFFFVSMVAVRIEMNWFDLVSEWRFFPQRMNLILRTWNFWYFSFYRWT